MERFLNYQILRVVDAGEDMVAVRDAFPGIPTDQIHGEVFWALYGRRFHSSEQDVMLAELIADLDSYQSARGMYFAITGIDCGAPECDHDWLPATTEPLLLRTIAHLAMQYEGFLAGAEQDFMWTGTPEELTRRLSDNATQFLVRVFTHYGLWNDDDYLGQLSDYGETMLANFVETNLLAS